MEAYSAIEDYTRAMVALEKAAETDKSFANSSDYLIAKQQLEPLLSRTRSGKPFGLR